MKLAVQGVGVVGGFGCGIESLKTALIDRTCQAQSVSVKTAQGPREMPAFLADTAKLDDFSNKKVLRRVDHFSKMALLGSFLALQDAGRLEGHRQRMGLVVATGYGACRTTFAFLDSFYDSGDQLSSPTHFSNSVHNAAGANISMILDISGPGLTVSQFEMSVPSALLTAGTWLEEDRVDSVLFGGVDEYSELLGYCWHRFFGDRWRGVRHMDPLAFTLQSAIPGEGAAFFLLTRAEEGNPSPYGFIGEVAMGRYGRGPLALPEKTLFFIGADGHRPCGSFYQRLLPEQASTACYTPLYGSLPVAPVFDLAIAALSIKNNRVFSSPQGGNEGLEMRIIGEETDLHWEQICCLKIGGEGEWGSITLSPFPIKTPLDRF
jgi:3-oxoacyl-[acyl-carrier-protein] synthase II